MRIIQDAMDCLIQIRRVAFARNKSRHWNQHCYYGIMLPLVNAWQRRIATLFPDVDVITHGLGLSCPSSILHSTYSCITRIKLDESIRAIRSLLHGRNHRDMRARMNARVAKIEQLRIEKKLGKVIRLLGDAEYTSLDLSTLREGDGKSCTT
jgi:hypothetical protein